MQKIVKFVNEKNERSKGKVIINYKSFIEVL